MSVMRAVYGIGSLRGIGDDAALDPLGTALARMSDPNVSNEEKRELEALLNDLRNRAVVVRDKGQAPSTAPVVVPSNGGGGGGFVPLPEPTPIPRRRSLVPAAAGTISLATVIGIGWYGFSRFL